MVPEAWQNDITMPANKKAFYRWSAFAMEPWDGPGGLPFSVPCSLCISHGFTFILFSNSPSGIHWWTVHWGYSGPQWLEAISFLCDQVQTHVHGQWSGCGWCQAWGYCAEGESVWCAFCWWRDSSFWIWLCLGSAEARSYAARGYPREGIHEGWCHQVTACLSTSCGKLALIRGTVAFDYPLLVWIVTMFWVHSAGGHSGWPVQAP